MLRLTTFGGVSLTRDGQLVAGIVDGWRRRGLFALLAANQAAGVSRELLASLLWPESPSERARHSLQQLIYGIRRPLGADVFEGTQTLRLDPALVSTDVTEFEAAVQRHRLELAATLYLGAFAEDLGGEASGELSRRLDALRGKYANAYKSSIEMLARGASERNDVQNAARWWQRLAEVDPLDSRVASQYIAAMVAGGERARALKFALVHEALVRAELHAPADAEIEAWIRRLRASTHSQSPGAAAPAFAPIVLDDGASPDRRVTRLARAIEARYRLGSVIGESAATMDFSATAADDPRREVSVRLIQPRVAAGTTSGRFREVLGRVATLVHPGLQSLLDFGSIDDLLFIICSQLPAMSLRDRLRQERELPVSDAVRIGRELSGALAHAHSFGVRHGDLRPKHVGFTPSGVLLSGTGLVEALTSRSVHDTTSTVVSLGSPTYLSPEQLTRHTAIDARCDVYALGAILYEMLVGEPPFGRSPQADAIGRKLTDTAPSVRTRRERVPAELAEIVATALARVPADRFASAGELADALGTVTVS